MQLSEDSFDSLAVFTQKPAAGTLSMLGKWEQVGSIQYFQARFSFQQGKKYWVKLARFQSTGVATYLRHSHPADV